MPGVVVTAVARAAGVVAARVVTGVVGSVVVRVLDLGRVRSRVVAGVVRHGAGRRRRRGPAAVLVGAVGGLGAVLDLGLVLGLVRGAGRGRRRGDRRRHDSGIVGGMPAVVRSRVVRARR